MIRDFVCKAGFDYDASGGLGDGEVDREVHVHVVRADLDADSDNTNGTAPPDHSPHEESIEGRPPGKYVLLNDDVEEVEDDLVPVVLDFSGLGSRGNDLNYRLSVQQSPSRVRLWADPRKEALFAVGALQVLPPSTQLTVWVEGVALSAAPGDVLLRKELVDTTKPENVVVASDEVRMTVVTVNLVAHRTGGKFGEAVSRDVEDDADPAKYVVLTNNDFEEGVGDGARDFEDDDAVIPSGTPTDEDDDDLAKVVLKRLPAGFSNGKFELVLSNPGAVRLFKADGSLLYREGQTSTDALTLYLNSPSGYLAGLMSSDVVIWAEGLTKAPNLRITALHTAPSGQPVARDDVHMNLVDVAHVGANSGEEVWALTPMWGEALLAGASHPEHRDGEDLFAHPAANAYFAKTRLLGLSNYSAVTLTYSSVSESSDEVEQQLVPGESPGEYVGQRPVGLYNWDVLYATPRGPLTAAERQTLRDAFGVDVVHNEHMLAQIETEEDRFRRPIGGRDVDAEPPMGVEVAPADMLAGDVFRPGADATFTFRVANLQREGDRQNASQRMELTGLLGPGSNVRDQKHEFEPQDGVMSLTANDLPEGVYSVTGHYSFSDFTKPVEDMSYSESSSFTFIVGMGTETSRYKLDAWKLLRGGQVGGVAERGIARNRQITAAYASVYDREKRLTWPGMAAFVSAEAGSAMTSAGQGNLATGVLWGLDEILEEANDLPDTTPNLWLVGRADDAMRLFSKSSELLPEGNWAIFWDMTPTFLAYLDPAHAAPEQRLAAVATMLDQRLIERGLYNAWETAHAGLTSADPAIAAQKLAQGRREMAEHEQRVAIQRAVMEPHRAHWLEFTNRFGGYIKSSIPGTGRFIDFVDTPDFGDPSDRLEWFDEDLVSKWDAWKARNPGAIDVEKLYGGEYKNT